MTRLVKGFMPLLGCLLCVLVAPGFAVEPASRFDAYLKGNPNAPIIEKSLGKLTGPDGTQATFTALLAGDPSNPSLQARAVRVEVKQGQERTGVYLDEEIICRNAELGILPDDSLKIVLEELSRLVADKDSIVAEMNARRGSRDAPRGWGATAGAYNSPVGALRTGRSLPVPAVTVLNVGWEGRREALGVELIIVPAKRDYFFPGADLAQVRDMIASAREFFGVSDDHEPSGPCSQR